MSVKMLTASLFLSSTVVFSATVNTDMGLNQAIITANTGADTTINFQNSITLTNAFGQPLLRPLNTLPNFVPTTQIITINGNNFTLSGAGGFRGFFARGGTININNLNFTNTFARGGNGGNAGPGGSGGGGAGFGGALFVGTGSTVNLTNPTFTNSNATGGSGGTSIAANDIWSGGGGGGFTGNGGVAHNLSHFSGGGGGGALAYAGGNSSVGGSPTGDGGGGGGGTGGVGQDGAAAGGTGGADFAGTAGGIGGVNGSPGGPGTGGGGGDPISSVNNGNGGAGGIGGGGGGAGATQATLAAAFLPPTAHSGGIGNEFGGGGGGANAQGTVEGCNGGDAFSIADSITGFAGGGGGGAAIDFPLTTAGVGGDASFGGGGGGGGFDGVDASPGAAGNRGFGGGNGLPGTGGTGSGGGGAGFGGAIFIQKGGIVNVLGSANFTGNTTKGGSGGTGAENGLAAGSDIYMMSSSALSFTITSNVDIPNPIEGNQGQGADITGGGGDTTTGGLTKAGCARLTLNGANTFTGTTEVAAGELRVNGSLVTDVHVSPGAIFSGNASILPNIAATNTGSLVNDGFVSPGNNGVGQINVAGNFINNADGTVVVDITPAGAIHDTIMVAGTTSILGGTLDVIINPGNYIAGTQYVVIQGPSTGAFTSINKIGPNANFVDIGVTYGSVIVTVLSSRIFQDQVIAAGIPFAVANCIIGANIIPQSNFALAVESLGLLTGSDLNRSLYSLTPVNYGALDWINARNNNYLADILSEHLFQLCCSPRDCCGCDCNASVWIDVFGNLMNNRKRFDHLAPFTANAVGVVAGLDYCFCQNYTFGGAFAYSHTWLDWKKGYGHGDINSYYGALYGSYQGCCVTIDLSVIGGASDHELKRRIQIQGNGSLVGLNTDLCTATTPLVTTTVPVNFRDTAHSDVWGYFFTGHLGISTNWDWCCTTFEPFGLVDYNYFHRNHIKEHGADGLSLRVREHHQNMLRGEAGLKAYRTWACECSCFAPYIGLSWVGEFPLEHSKQRASFVDQSCTFSVTSYHSSVQLASPMAGLKWTYNCGMSWSVGYKGLFNRKTSINEVDARLEWIF